MTYYSLKPQDPIPASATAEQLAKWYSNLSETMAKLKDGRKQLPFLSRAHGKMDYLIQRHKHELKKIREAAAARSFASFGIDLSQFKGISYAD